MKSPKNKQAGFTIIELMIATAVFAMVLLVILTAVTQIGRMYYKGITTSQTQESARAVLESVAQQIQFSSSVPAPLTGVTGTADGSTGVFCIGSARFVFVMNRQVSTGTVGANQTRHALWIDQGGGTGPACTSTGVSMSGTTPTSGLSGYEALPSGTRILRLSVEPLNAPLNSLWKVTVRVAFGDQDLLEGADGSPMNSTNFPTAVCKGSQIGTQFCAVSELETTVLRRVTQ